MGIYSTGKESKETSHPVEWYENYDMENVVTPVNVDVFERLLIQSNYNKSKRIKLINGFRNGFSLHYEGEMKVKKTAPDLKLRIGTLHIWTKVMTEVKAGHYAGPYQNIPFEFFIQSPIGLVPKDKGHKTRLIFHLSYPRSGGSVNAGIPERFCTVKYKDFDMAVKKCLGEGVSYHVGKSDMSMAFRNLPLDRKSWPYLVLKAKHPETGEYWYFFDECLPFGSSISCKLFQDFSDSVAHLCTYCSKKSPVNYLDDYLFVALLKVWCNWQLQNFLNICSEICFPVSLDKTEWGTTLLVFLGLLLDMERQMVCIPYEKIVRAKELVSYYLNTKNKKTTVHMLQKLCGFLNFLCKVVVPGRAFTMRLYSHIGPQLLPHHHLCITGEMRLDLQIWDLFLNNANVFCRPFMDFKAIQAEEVDFYTDASGSWDKGGIGAICGNSWIMQKWDKTLMQEINPSIEYLELYALTAALLNWLPRFKNREIYVFVDNESIKTMINKSSSWCRNCMVLIRFITLHSLVCNVRVFAKHLSTHKNVLADALSRLNWRKFKSHVKHEVDSF